MNEHAIHSLVIVGVGTSTGLLNIPETPTNQLYLVGMLNAPSSL